MTLDPTSPPDPAPYAEAIAAAVTGIEGTVGFLDRTLQGRYLGPVGWRTAAALLRRVREARKRLATLEQALEAHIAVQMRHDGIRGGYGQPTEGVGLVEWNRSRKRSNWQHRDLASAVIDAHMVATGGEAPDPYTVRDWILESAAPAYWRVTPLRAIGINPDDYSLSEPGVPTVKIT